MKAIWKYIKPHAKILAWGLLGNFILTAVVLDYIVVIMQLWQWWKPLAFVTIIAISYWIGKDK